MRIAIDAFASNLLVVSVDGSPSTFWRLYNWEEHPGNSDSMEPQHITAHAIRRLTPHAKFIVMLREPAERYIDKDASMPFNNINLCINTLKPAN